MAESKGSTASSDLPLSLVAGASLKTYRSKLQPYYYLCKPGIVYSNVLSGVAGYIFASKWNLDIKHLLALTAGTGLIIASACVANNYIDRGIDSKMKRTKIRASVTGVISGTNMILFSLILGIIGFTVLFLTNILTVYIGVFAFISYVGVYGYVKRKSIYGTLAGTLPGGASIVAGYSAATGELNLAALLLLLIMITWQMAHFYSIAIYRIDEYKKTKLPLWPIVKGIRSAKIQIGLFAVLFIISNWALSIFGYAGELYSILMTIVGLIWFRIILSGKNTKNDQLWAKKSFLFSLITLLTFFILLPFSFLLP